MLVGEVLLCYVIDLLLCIDVIYSELFDYMKGVVGCVCVFVNILVISQDFFDQLCVFLQCYCDIKLQISELRSVDILQVLCEGCVDVGIVMLCIVIEGIYFVFYCMDWVSVVVFDDYLLIGELIDFSVLFDYDLVVFDDCLELMCLFVREVVLFGKLVCFCVQVQSFEVMCWLIVVG